MPIYEYVCGKCGAHIEKIQKFSDAPLIECQKCGGKLERLISPPAIQFKGSGWYVTDYARKPAPVEGSSSSKSDGAGEKAKNPAAESATTKASETKASSEK